MSNEIIRRVDTATALADPLLPDSPLVQASYKELSRAIQLNDAATALGHASQLMFLAHAGVARNKTLVSRVIKMKESVADLAADFRLALYDISLRSRSVAAGVAELGREDIEGDEVVDILSECVDEASKLSEFAGALAAKFEHSKSEVTQLQSDSAVAQATELARAEEMKERLTLLQAQEGALKSAMRVLDTQMTEAASAYRDATTGQAREMAQSFWTSVCAGGMQAVMGVAGAATTLLASMSAESPAETRVSPEIENAQKNLEDTRNDKDEAREELEKAERELENLQESGDDPGNPDADERRGRAEAKVTAARDAYAQCQAAFDSASTALQNASQVAQDFAKTYAEQCSVLRREISALYDKKIDSIRQQGELAGAISVASRQIDTGVLAVLSLQLAVGALAEVTTILREMETQWRQFASFWREAVSRLGRDPDAVKSIALNGSRRTRERLLQLAASWIALEMICQEFEPRARDLQSEVADWTTLIPDINSSREQAGKLAKSLVDRSNSQIKALEAAQERLGAK